MFIMFLLCWHELESSLPPLCLVCLGRAPTGGMVPVMCHCCRDLARAAALPAVTHLWGPAVHRAGTVVSVCLSQRLLGFSVQNNIGLVLHGVMEYDLSLRFLENALAISSKYHGSKSLKVALR